MARALVSEAGWPLADIRGPEAVLAMSFSTLRLTCYQDLSVPAPAHRQWAESGKGAVAGSQHQAGPMLRAQPVLPVVEGGPASLGRLVQAPGSAWLPFGRGPSPMVCVSWSIRELSRTWSSFCASGHMVPFLGFSLPPSHPVSQYPRQGPLRGALTVLLPDQKPPVSPQHPPKTGRKEDGIPEGWKGCGRGPESGEILE